MQKCAINRTFKGFTIVELAIVLVVIGVILSMAVKGKALVEVAILKAEVNKVRKLEAAMHIFAATHVGFSKGTQWNTLDMQAFYDLDIVSKGELKSSYLGPAALNTQYNPQINGDYDATYTPTTCGLGRNGYYFTRGDNTQAANMFCAGLVYYDFDPNGPGGGASWRPFIPAHVQCGIEQMMDDENVSSGTGRRAVAFPYSAVNVFELTEAEYADCLSIPKDKQTREYLYRIF